MNKYLSAISANFIFFIVNTLFFILIMPITIRVLGETFFGLWSVLYAMMLLSNIGTLGISSIVSKFAAEIHTKDLLADQAFGEVIIAGLFIVLPMALIVGLVLMVARQWIAQAVTSDPELQGQFSRALLWVAFSVFPLFLSQVLQGFLLSQLQNRIVRQIEAVSSIILWTGVVLSVLLFGRDLELVTGWCLINSMVSLAFYFLAVRRRAKLVLRFCPVRVRAMLNFSGYMFLESIAIALFQNLDRVLVGFVLGPAIAGIYSVGTSVGTRLSMVVGQATQVMIPFASLKTSENDTLRLYVVFRRMSKYISLLVAGLGGLLILWMDNILSLWISPAYASSYGHIFRLLIVGYGLLSLVRPAHQSLTGLGKVKVTSLIYSVSTIGMLTSLFFLSSRFGFLGAALANSVPVLLLVMNLYTYKRLTGRMELREMFADLKWGIFLPILMFTLVLLGLVFWLKIVMTMALVSLIAIILFKDDLAQPWLINQAKHVLQRLISYA